jgi:hypothetical protein
MHPVLALSNGGSPEKAARAACSMQTRPTLEHSQVETAGFWSFHISPGYPPRFTSPARYLFRKASPPLKGRESGEHLALLP